MKKAILIVALLGSWLSLIIMFVSYYAMLGRFCEATFGGIADICFTRNMRTFGAMALIMFGSTAALSFFALRNYRKD